MNPQFASVGVSGADVQGQRLYTHVEVYNDPVVPEHVLLMIVDTDNVASLYIEPHAARRLADFLLDSADRAESHRDANGEPA